jgi:hypothetical protein
MDESTPADAAEDQPLFMIDTQGDAVNTGNNAEEDAESTYLTNAISKVRKARS